MGWKTMLIIAAIAVFVLWAQMTLSANGYKNLGSFVPRLGGEGGGAA